MTSILGTYTSKELKLILKNHGFNNYSKLNKAGIIEIMTKPENINLFKDIQEKKKKVEEKNRISKLQKESNQQFKESKKIRIPEITYRPPKITESQIREKIKFHKLRILETPSKKQIKIIKEKKLLKTPETFISFD